MSLTAAYFSPDTIDELYTVDHFPDIGEVMIPEGMFCSARVGNRSARRRSAENAKRLSVTPPRVLMQAPPSTALPVLPVTQASHPRRTLSTPMDPRMHDQASSSFYMGERGPSAYSPVMVSPSSSNAHSRPRHHSSAAGPSHPYRTYREPVDPRSLHSSPSPTPSYSSSLSSTTTYPVTPATSPGDIAFPGMGIPSTSQSTALRLAPLEYLENLATPPKRHPLDEVHLQSFNLAT
jgi:hypothetical protein